MKTFEMTLMDVAIALLLAARLHGTDAAVRETAKRCAKYLPRSERQLMYLIVSSRNPLQIVATLTNQLAADQ